VGRNSVDASQHGLETLELQNFASEYWNLRPATLIVEALRRREGTLAANGALVALTGMRTGRSPRDKYVVKDAASADHVHWGKINVPIEPERFDAFQEKVFRHLRFQDIFVQDLHCGAHPDHRLKVRIITERAWHSLFVRQLFIRPEREELREFEPDFTVLCAPNCLADPHRDQIRSETFVLVNFARKLVLIGGTQYAGEMKKSIFTVMNYLLPQKGVLSMHCSANIGKDGDTAVFFGLSGTGKTTLSADPNRRLIGDDEHGWGDDGVFNFEGGCYAKAINLSQEYEPQIYNAIRFGAVLENVILDPATREPRFDNDYITENTRAAYPLDYIDNAVIPSRGGHPSNIVFLTCDAFGVLPPVARLTPAQAMYHFLSGYTAKVAGTEAGVTEPQATFSTCFGAPFMILDPTVYADLLGQKIAQHNAKVWLVNTGWTGGPHGVGSRMKLPYTRAMVSAILDRGLDDVSYQRDPVFGVDVPQSCPNVPSELLDPKSTWSDPAAYDEKARDLAGRFIENFKQFETASADILDAGPKL
jgi:phosphoenolpyruvate carboxykinase (ATP)